MTTWYVMATLPFILTVQVSPPIGVPARSTLAAVALVSRVNGRISKATEKTPGEVLTISMTLPSTVTIQSAPRSSSRSWAIAEAMASVVAPPAGTTYVYPLVCPPTVTSRRQISFAVGLPDSVTVHVSSSTMRRSTANRPPRVPGAGSTASSVPNTTPSRLTITNVPPSSLAKKPFPPSAVPNALALMSAVSAAVICARVVESLVTS